MNSLTGRQQQILQYIQREIQEKGVAPSVREIAAHFDVSAATMQQHLDALRRKKALDASDSSHRGLRLANHRPTIQVPVLGQVRAGAPILAEENIESYVAVDRDVARGGKLFALKVVGDSMKDAGIFANDTAIVRQQPAAQNGQIVVAVKDNEATVKVFRQRRGQIFLEPANPNYQPIPADGFSIAGVLVGLIRSYQN